MISPASAIDLQRAHDVDAAAVGQVEQMRWRHRCRWQLTNAGSGGLLGAADDVVGQGLDVIETVRLAKRSEPLGANFAGGHLGVEIAGHVIGLTDVGKDELPDVVVAFAFLHQLADRDPQTLFEHVPTPSTDPVAADVGVVNGGTEQRDDAAVRATPGPAR